jgi:hypothetical protein
MKRAFLYMLVAAALVPIAYPAAGQDLREQVESELARTDRRIEQAEEVVAESDVAAARLELAEAVRIQSGARSAQGQGRPRMALDLTYRARSRADRAIALVEGLPDPDRVLAQLDRTRDLLERMRQRVEECDRDRARAGFLAAVEMQRRAEEAARGGRYLAALQLTLGSRERAHRALRMCRLEEDSREGAERALQRTDEAIARAREAAGESSSDRTREALSRATALQDRARAEFAAARHANCLRLTSAARTWAYRALRWSAR